MLVTRPEGEETSRNQVQEERGSQAKMKSHLCLWRKEPPPFPTYKCRQVQSSIFAVIILIHFLGQYYHSTPYYYCTSIIYRNQDTTVGSNVERINELLYWLWPASCLLTSSSR